MLFIYSLIFIIINYFAIIVSQNTKSTTNTIFWILFSFLMIVIIGKTYDVVYIKSIMMNKKSFIIMLVFSWAIMPLSLINSYNNKTINERLNKKEIPTFLFSSSIPVYVIALTLLITLFQLIIIWNKVQFPSD